MAGYLIYFVCLAMAMYKMATINIEGLHNPKKRIEVFKNLIKNKYDIIALQETHCTEEVEPQWKEEWPGLSYWTTGKSTQAGVAFLFNKDLDVKLIDDDPDLQGRILRLTVQINETKIQLVNIYGYNAINEQKSEYLFSQMNQHIDNEIPPLIFGDFNMVEDPDLDRRGGNPTIRHTYGKKALQEIKEDYELVDAWRHLHPKMKSYTWQSRAANIQSRLDRVYIPKQFMTIANKAYIREFLWSDHDVCIVECEFPTDQRKGRGYWKLNLT